VVTFIQFSLREVLKQNYPNNSGGARGVIHPFI
jgi:hypothetical protein